MSWSIFDNKGDNIHIPNNCFAFQNPPEVPPVRSSALFSGLIALNCLRKLPVAFTLGNKTFKVAPPYESKTTQQLSRKHEFFYLLLSEIQSLHRRRHHIHTIRHFESYLDTHRPKPNTRNPTPFPKTLKYIYLTYFTHHSTR